MKMMPNERMVTIKIPRGWLCKLLVLLACAIDADPKNRMTCSAIRMSLSAQLKDHDAKYKEVDA